MRWSGLLALLLGVAASLLVACGQTNGLLSSADAGSLGDPLDSVSNAVADSNCGAAAKAAAKLREEAAALPATVDVRLRRDLQGGAATVARKALTACRQTTTTETVTTDTTTIPTETTPTVTTPTVTTPTVTTPTVTTPTITTPTTPTPTVTTPTVPTSPSGGVGPGTTTP